MSSVQGDVDDVHSIRDLGISPTKCAARDHPFELRLPDDSKIDAKVCQDGSKALMSNPNKDLGKWILRQVMNLAEGELLTYDRLEELGLDSVVIYKEAPSMYSIDFTPLGSYDEFRDRL